LNQAGTTVVMVTHSEAYAEFARRVIHLLDGRVVRETNSAPVEADLSVS
jgi:putative ABC transport system ATP-binding protein